MIIELFTYTDSAEQLSLPFRTREDAERMEKFDCILDSRLLTKDEENELIVIVMRNRDLHEQFKTIFDEIVEFQDFSKINESKEIQ